MFARSAAMNVRPGYQQLHPVKSSGFGPDLLQFRDPSSGSTLALPVSIMLESQEVARTAVQNKLKSSAKKFSEAV